MWSQGLQWMVALHDYGLNGILADEPGLGKTIQVGCRIPVLISLIHILAQGYLLLVDVTISRLRQPQLLLVTAAQPLQYVIVIFQCCSAAMGHANLVSFTQQWTFK